VLLPALLHCRLNARSRQTIDIRDNRKIIYLFKEYILFYNMVIIINIDVMLAKQKMSVTELVEKAGITMSNI